MIKMTKPYIMVFGKKFHIKSEHNKIAAVIVLIYYIYFLYLNCMAIGGASEYFTGVSGWIVVLILITLTVKITIKKNNIEYIKSILPLKVHATVWIIMSSLGLYWVFMESNWDLLKSIFLTCALLNVQIKKMIEKNEKVVIEKNIKE